MLRYKVGVFHDSDFEEEIIHADNESAARNIASDLPRFKQYDIDIDVYVIIDKGEYL